MTPPSVEVRASKDVAAGVFLWRGRGRLWATVVVKATFAMRHEAAAMPISPAPIEPDDRSFDKNPARSVEAAGDLVPFRGRCDVTFVGHAHAPGGAPAMSAAVRFALLREKRILFERILHVFGERKGKAARASFTRMPLTYERSAGGPGHAANPVGTDRPPLVDPGDPARPAAFGPISRFWPSRKRLASASDRKALEGPIPEWQESLSGAYFQCAPEAQQTEYLSGGEWIVLDGLHPAIPRMMTQVPHERAVARAVSGTAVVPVDLVADTLAIDGDRERFSIVWRGRLELASHELVPLTVEAALEFPGQPADFADVVARALAHEGAELAGNAGGTVAVMGDASLGAPFEVSKRPPRARLDASATPWGGAVLSKPKAAAFDARTAAMPVMTEPAATPDGTLDVSAATEVRPVVPFAAAVASPGRRASADATPWGNSALQAPPSAAPGEETLAQREVAPPRARLAPAPGAQAPARPASAQGGRSPFAKPRGAPSVDEIADELAKAGASDASIDAVQAVLASRGRKV